MKKRTKSVLGVLLAVMMVLTLLPAVSYAYLTDITLGDLTISVDNDIEGLYFSEIDADDYNVLSSTSGYYPFSFSLILDPYTDVDSIATTGGATVTQYDGNYYLVQLPEGNPSTIEITNTDQDSVTLHCSAPSGGSSGGTGIYACLPAPGQFTNEGMGSGGWGDVYNEDGELKGMVGTTATTGVSLGYFGGYLVFDLGMDGTDPSKGVLHNVSAHPDGIDFVVEGNGFPGNSEPGNIQVSLNGTTWYDIAGSFHYDADTDWDYEVTYINPTPSDNPSGTVGTRVNVPYLITGDGQSYVAINTFHNHSWFPLNANYFVTRTISGQSCPPVHRATGTGKLPFATYLTGQDMSAYVPGLTNTETLKLSGVHLGGVTTNKSAADSFGYFDVASGGDGIDLAWAVYSGGDPNAGEPISSTIMDQGFRFVRVYNGVAQDQPPFGELSPEIRRISLVTDTSGGGTTAEPSVTVGGTTVTPASTPASATPISIPAGVDKVATASATGNTLYVNSAYGTGSASKTFNLEEEQTQIVRIVSWDTTTANPYIGYIKLVGEA